jgi:hypothetical protein
MGFEPSVPRKRALRRFPVGREKTLLSPQSSRLNVENLLEISGLRRILPSWPAAEFLPGLEAEKAARRELAAEFGAQPVACVFIMTRIS